MSEVIETYEAIIQNNFFLGSRRSGGFWLDGLQQQTDAAWNFSAERFAIASGFGDSGGSAAGHRAGSGQISANAGRVD